ncbi:MAG: adenylosuccinate synthetase, partial [Thermoguttaceae bacterium]
MPATCVIGLQWGDEAKGKIVDLLTKQNEIVVRFQGGANAGHTVVCDGKKYKLSLIPSGIFNPSVKSVIANGVVINPASILQEIETLTSQGVQISDNLMISDRAHVIFPWHALEDRIFDAINGKEAIGSTMRGIGPCYKDKVGRSLAIRVGDLYRDDLKERIEKIVEVKKRQLLGLVSSENELSELDPAKIFADFTGYAAKLKPYVCDTTAFLLDAVDANKKILFEGAQGSLLDIDHGTFPYVTSSNSSGTGVSSGSGVPGSYIT